MHDDRYYPRKSPALNHWIGSLILAACLGCWIIGYIFSVGYPVYGGVLSTPLWNMICQALPGKLFTYLAGFLLMVLGGGLLYRANLELRFVREKTWLPFLLYTLLISCNPNFLPLSATSLGTFCLIIALYELFSSYHTPDQVGKAFNAALLIGIGSLLWIHILWFLPMFWYGMRAFRVFNLRGFIASLLGVGIVYWLLFGWNLLIYDIHSFTAPFSSLLKIHPLEVDEWDFWQTTTVVWLVIMTIIASINILIHEYEDNLRTRQFLSFLILFACWAFGLFIFYEQTFDELMEIACIPCSILLSHYFTVRRGKIVFGIFLLTLALFIARFIAHIWNFL